MTSNSQAEDAIHKRSLCNSGDLATVRDVAELLHVSETWVYARTRSRGLQRIPHFKLGKYLRFSKDEVLDWVQRQRGN